MDLLRKMKMLRLQTLIHDQKLAPNHQLQPSTADEDSATDNWEPQLEE